MARITPQLLRDFLKEHGTEFEEKSIKDGTQFRCQDGEIFDLYETGTLTPRGRKSKLSEEVQALTAGPVAARPAATVQTGQHQVFIVYGHDTIARESLELLLHRMGLKPIVLGNLPGAGETIIEKLDHYLGQPGNVAYACVLVTPDDEGHKANKPEEKRYRARQNVVLELGMVLARLGRSRVAILIKQSVEQPSDIAGLVYIPFDERVDEVKAKLFKELQEAGFNPSTEGL